MKIESGCSLPSEETTMTKFANVLERSRNLMRRANPRNEARELEIAESPFSENFGELRENTMYAGISAVSETERQVLEIARMQQEAERAREEYHERSINQMMGQGLLQLFYSQPLGGLANQQSAFWPFNYPWEAGMGAPKKLPEEVVEEPSRSMLKRAKIDLESLDLSDPRKRLAAEAEALLGYTPLREELRAPGTLKRVLAKLEIAVLEQESVDRYKAQMVEHYRTAGKMLDPTWRLKALKDCKDPVPEFALQKAVEIKRELPEAQFYIDQLAMDPFLIVSLRTIPDSRVNYPSRYLDDETAAYVEVWSEPKFEAAM